MRRPNKIPKSMQSILWSYNLNEIDLEKDKDMVITQVLNYGSWEDLKWLYSVYKEEDIKKVVSHPGRGMWFEKVLNFWEKMLDLRVAKRPRQKAIFSLNPKF